jgi:hypothetical protein
MTFPANLIPMKYVDFISVNMDVIQTTHYDFTGVVGTGFRGATTAGADQEANEILSITGSWNWGERGVTTGVADDIVHAHVVVCGRMFSGKMKMFSCWLGSISGSL